MPNLCKIIIFGKTTAITKNSLHIEELKDSFHNEFKITIEDIIRFYRQFDAEVGRSTIDWRIFKLKEEGILHPISRGVYSLSNQRRIYEPNITGTQIALYKATKKQFPFIDVCIWETRWINEFMLHQPGRFYTILEPEKDVVESVFYYLKDLGKNVYLDPTEEEMDKYVQLTTDPIIITGLISEAPTQNLKGVITSTLEKMLVDILTNEVLFAAQRGAELYRIFEDAYEKYTISNSKLLRYAGRRNRQIELKQLINKIQRNGNKDQ